MDRTLPKKINDTPLPTNWVDYIQDSRLQVKVPVGTRYQAALPSLLLDYEDKQKYMSESSKWLGTKIWEPELSTLKDDDGSVIDDVVGKGRPALCPCEFSGDAECIQMHIVMQRIKLQFELGNAYMEWRFNEMGEGVSMSWTQAEQNKFKFIVKTNCTPNGIGFLKPALRSFPYRSSESIVSYYFNVYLPRRISEQSRSGCRIVDSDNEGPVEEAEVRSTKKKFHARAGTSRGGGIGKARFLAGKR